MKIKLLVIFFILVKFLNAQIFFSPEVLIGITKSEGSTNFPQPVLNELQKSSIGFDILIRNKQKLLNRLSIYPEIGYEFVTFKKVKSNLNNNVQNFHFINISLLLNYEILNRLSFIAGPSLNVLLNNPKLIRTKQAHFFITTGIQYQIYKNFNLGFNYNFSINNYNKDDNILVGIPPEPASFYLNYYSLFLTIPLTK